MTETNLFVGSILGSLVVPHMQLAPKVVYSFFFYILKKWNLDEERGSIQTRLTYRKIKAQLI